LQQLRKYISFFLLAVSSLFIVPKGLVHELTSHVDSHDENHQAGAGLNFTTIHHHCEILQVYESPFHTSDPVFQFVATGNIADVYNAHFPFFSLEADPLFTNRGPPAFSADYRSAV
jgi:hypothetical protein